jgi:hypothetical protein
MQIARLHLNYSERRRRRRRRKLLLCFSIYNRKCTCEDMSIRWPDNEMASSVAMSENPNLAIIKKGERKYLTNSIRKPNPR